MTSTPATGSVTTVHVYSRRLTQRHIAAVSPHVPLRTRLGVIERGQAGAYLGGVAPAPP